MCELPPGPHSRKLQEDSVELERMLPPTLSSTMLLVDEGEAQHLEKKKTLLEKQIEAEERKIKAQEAKIEAEKRRSEAFIAMTKYYSK